MPTRRFDLPNYALSAFAVTSVSASAQLAFVCAIHPDRHGRDRPRFLRFGRWPYLLFVEPRLIGNLDVVSVRVADVCREVAGTPFGPKARFLV